jgi:hypothetical protein
MPWCPRIGFWLCHGRPLIRWVYAMAALLFHWEILWPHFQWMSLYNCQPPIEWVYNMASLSLGESLQLPTSHWVSLCHGGTHSVIFMSCGSFSLDESIQLPISHWVSVLWHSPIGCSDFGFFAFLGIATHPWHPKGPRIWKLANKIFQLHPWQKPENVFFCIISKFNFRNSVWRIFSACVIYGILNTHIKS